MPVSERPSHIKPAHTETRSNPESQNTPSEQFTNESKVKSKTGMVVGIVAGLTVVIIAVVLMLILLVHRKRTEENDRTSDQETELREETAENPTASEELTNNDSMFFDTNTFEEHIESDADAMFDIHFEEQLDVLGSLNA